MKKITALYAVTALAALSFAGQAFAMGGSMMQGNAGGRSNMGSHMRQGGMSGMMHGSGSGSGGRREAMHEQGSQNGGMAEAGIKHGQMNETGQHPMMNTGTRAGGSDAQTVTPSPAAKQ